VETHSGHQNVKIAFFRLFYAVQRSGLGKVKILLYHEIRNEHSFNLRYISTFYDFGKYGLGGGQSFRATLYLSYTSPIFFDWGFYSFEKAVIIFIRFGFKE